MATNTINQGCGSLIYCTSTHRYLFLLRNNGKTKNTWGLVGGKIEAGESIQDGLIREIREELGGEIRDAKIIPIEKYTSDNNKFVYHTFLIKVEHEFIPYLNNEHKGYCWVPLDDYPKPLHPGVYKTIKIERNRSNIIQETSVN
jgi:8-oxo-dGTP pyrophosphatase MutT (NUDIX family)